MGGEGFYIVWPAWVSLYALAACVVGRLVSIPLAMAGGIGLVQVLSLVAMEPPASLSAEDVRDEKIKAMHSAREFTPEAVAEGILSAMQKPRPNVYVPKSLGISSNGCETSSV